MREKSLFVQRARTRGGERKGGGEGGKSMGVSVGLKVLRGETQAPATKAEDTLGEGER